MVALVTHWLEIGVADRDHHARSATRPPAASNWPARIEGFSVPGEAGRASSVAAPAGGATRRRRASVAQRARDRCRRRLHRRRNLAACGARFTRRGTQQIGIDRSTAHPRRRAAQARRRQADRLANFSEIDLPAASVLCAMRRSRLRNRRQRQGLIGGNAHLRAAPVRRAGRRLRLGAGRIRHGADGARHLALRAAALARGAAGADLLGDRADLDAALDVEEL